MKLVCASSLALAMLLVALNGSADSPRHVEALRHFELGRKARLNGDIATAIVEFKSSLDSERSVGALFNLGAVYEQQGHHRAALDSYEQARTFALSTGDVRASEALDAQRTIRDAHSWVTVVVRAEAAALKDLRIIVDDELVPPSELNAEVFRDRSRHVVVASADGRAEARLTAADHGVVEISSATLPPRPSPAPPPPLRHAPPNEERPTWRLWTGLGLGVAGAAATGLGVVATLAYASARSDLGRDQTSLGAACATGRCPSNAAAASASNQQRYADNNHRAAAELGLSFGAGALLLGGAALLLTGVGSGGRGLEPTVDARRDGAGFGVRSWF